MTLNDISQALANSTISTAYVLSYEANEPPELWETLLYGLLAVGVTAIASPCVFLLVPYLPKPLYDRFMIFLVCLGVGAMSGSCLFILIPRAFKVTEMYGNEYLEKSWLIISALYLFFTVDRLLQITLEMKKKRAQKDTEVIFPTLKEQDARGIANESAILSSDLREVEEGRSINNFLSLKQFAQPQPNALKELVKYPVKRRRFSLDAQDCYSNTKFTDLKFPNEQMIYQPPSLIYSPQPDSIVELKDQRSTQVASIAYMIVFGSSINNFVDGLNLGAAYSSSLLRGFSISMSATTQQFPSEIGTLAILVNSGLTVRRALLLNFFASTLTFVGFCLSILMDNILIDNIYESYIFGFSAGMYLYVVLSSLIPEIREQFSNLVCEASTYEIVFTTVLQALGVFSGLNLIFGMNK